MTRAGKFCELLTAALNNSSFIKMTLGAKRSTKADLQNIYIRPVLIKDEALLSFVYRYPTNDVTKNYSAGESVEIIMASLEKDFRNADLFTSGSIIYYSVSKVGMEKLTVKSENTNTDSLQHDRTKKRLVEPSAKYLQALGISSSSGKPFNDMQHKYRQINRYVEIIDDILKSEESEFQLQIADMGSGKGYLTFALFDHLRRKFDSVRITGIEARSELVKKCNDIAAGCGFPTLHFVQGSILDSDVAGANMLIALHACDTATDDAIAKGIAADAKYIICAPCCHKQVRNDMHPENVAGEITAHGILAERQAEILTDTIRALLLQANGYHTRVFEFIREADTPKNVMIVAVKTNVPAHPVADSGNKIDELKKMFGLKKHYLEELLVKL